MHEVERVFLEAGPGAILSPPDVFAACATFVKLSGSYSEYAQTPPSLRVAVGRGARDGVKWMSVLNSDPRPKATDVPVRIRRAWAYLIGRAAKSLSDLSTDARFVESALYLIVAADQACAGIGIPNEDGAPKTSKPSGYFELGAESRINGLGTLCSIIARESLRVLPKQHTPQSGFNIRSLTHHLALCSASEVTPVWTLAPLPRRTVTSFNVLLAPWPLEVQASDIAKAARESSEPKDFGYFDYIPAASTNQPSVRDWIGGVLNAADKIQQRVDMVVFPECALTLDEWKEVSSHCAERKIVCIAGVREAGKQGQSGDNSLRVKLPAFPELDLVQYKHHRWQIRKSQISTYGLGGSLCSSKVWWENINIAPRELNFLALLPELVVCPLICEDLARQDPVAELVRSVGPNLVLALLMDGPQLADRWAARYASVLADDPGSSVITLSSLGMVRRSRPEHCEPSSVFASWKDASGRFVPLALAGKESALLLNLQFKVRKEWSIDGRHDGQAASTPVLYGIHPLEVGDAK